MYNVKYTSISLTINKNVDSSVRGDMKAFFSDTVEGETQPWHMARYLSLRTQRFCKFTHFSFNSTRPVKFAYKTQLQCSTNYIQLYIYRLRALYTVI